MIQTEEENTEKIATSQQRKRASVIATQMPKMILYTRCPEWYNMLCQAISYHISGSYSRNFRRLFHYGFNFMPGMRTFRLRQGDLLPILRISHPYSDTRFHRTDSQTQTEETPQAPQRIRKHQAPVRKACTAMGCLSPGDRIYPERLTCLLGTAIGYFESYNDAYQALMLYNNAPGDIRRSSVSFAELCAAMLSNRGGNRSPEHIDITFAELYDQYVEQKYEKSKKKLSNASRGSTRAAFNNCKQLHDKKFVDIRKADLQEVIDTCPLKHSSLELILSLFKGMYSYALQNDIVEKDYSQFVTINIPDDDERGVPFSADALDLLWQHSDREDVGMILLMIYTGFRIAAFQNLTYNETEQYFQGGVKTAAGKNRIVPLHPAVQGFARSFADQYCSGSKTFSAHTCRASFHATLSSLGLSLSGAGTKHTPHDCRHTFSWLCDKYGVDDLSKHLLMGHSLGNDVEKSVYGHRTVEELRTEIEKIQVPDCR